MHEKNNVSHLNYYPSINVQTPVWETRLYTVKYALSTLVLVLSHLIDRITIILLFFFFWTNDLHLSSLKRHKMVRLKAQHQMRYGKTSVHLTESEGCVSDPCRRSRGFLRKVEGEEKGLSHA